MREHYKNEFKDVDEGSIGSTINAFIDSLTAVKYDFVMNTGAAYDGKFNTAIGKLKGEDISSMISLCGSCNSQIIAKISEYKSKYAAYESEYSKCADLYKDYEDNLTKWNQKKLKLTRQPAPPDISKLIQKEIDLMKLADEIRNASF